MLKFLSLSFIILLFASFTSDDANKNKALTANVITFYGINFSKMKCIHRADFTDKIGNTQCESLVARYFTEWNEIFLTEREKFNAKKFFQVETAEIDLSISLKDVPNYSISDCVIEDDNYAITAEDIATIVAKYQNASGKGVGVVIVAQSLNKLKSKGTFYAAYFDVASGTVLYSSKVVGEPVGYGFSSYWINSLYEGLNINTGVIKKERKALNITPKSNW